MASLTITVPDAQVSRIVDAFKEFDNNAPGESNADFLRRKIGQYVLTVVKEFEARKDSNAAAAAARLDVEQDIPIT